MFGSFASVLIYRIKSGEGGIVNGRSHCKTCERDLSGWELIPLISWVIQGGKCKGCRKKISAVYPFLELTMGLLFVQVGYFLIDSNLIFSWEIFEWLRMFFFLSIMFLTVIYVFYDILYLEIPESILLAANIGTFWILVLHTFWWNIIPYLPVWSFSLWEVLLCFSIIWALYYVCIAGLRELYDCIIVAISILILGGYTYFIHPNFQDSALLSWTLAALGIYTSFFLQIVISKGRWMWAWDLRIGILMWLLVGTSFAFPAWMLTYLIGSIIGIVLIIISKVRYGLKADFQHQVPFGPFLAAWYLSILFFYPNISKFIAWYL
jgi:prepilin signal peptidase PulO-like enzyme (type II secretory pathway)